jgi:hypothetical protein
MSAQNGEVVGEDTIKKMGCVSSNLEDHIHYAQQYLDLGFDQLYFHTVGADQDKFLVDYGKDVLLKLTEKNLVKTSSR